MIENIVLENLLLATRALKESSFSSISGKDVQMRAEVLEAIAAAEAALRRERDTTLYCVTHEFAGGDSVLLVRTPVDLRLFVADCDAGNIDPDDGENPWILLAEALGLDFEPHKHEFIRIETAPEVIDLTEESLKQT